MKFLCSSIIFQLGNFIYMRPLNHKFYFNHKIVYVKHKPVLSSVDIVILLHYLKNREK